METKQTYTLRPLGIGEIFDRAVTLYVRNFVTFTLIVLTLLAPLAVVQYFVIPDQSSALTQAIGQIDHPKKQPESPLSNAEIGGLILVGALAFLLAPFVNNAVAVGVAQAYRGATPAYGSAFSTVFRRWAPLLGTALLNLGVLAGVYLLFALLMGALFAVAIIIGMHALAAAIVVGVLALAGGLAFLLFFLLLLIAYAFAMYSTSLENASPLRAISLAYGRIFNRGELKKATLMALAYVGLEFGVILLGTSVAMLLLLVVHSYALQLAVTSIVNAMLTAFLTILLAVYYYDVRTRAEGLDLESDLEALAAAAT